MRTTEKGRSHCCWHSGFLLLHAAGVNRRASVCLILRATVNTTTTNCSKQTTLTDATHSLISHSWPSFSLSSRTRCVCVIFSIIKPKCICRGNMNVFFYENHCVCLTAVSVGYPNPFTPPSPLCLPPMQLSVCAQFISFAAELFPTAASNSASLCHLLQQAAVPVYPAQAEAKGSCVGYMCKGAGSAGYLPAEQAQLSPCALPLLPLLHVFLHLLHIAAACRRYCWPANTLFRLIYWLAAAAGGQRSCHTHTQHTVLQGRVERDNSNCCIMYVGCTERGACLLVCQRQQQQQQQ